jgi:uncharacterized coiled-coil protein SlyX|tara:strand:- start:494 stop:709 length:216 start_codon:yes stop_codon:yes gene_type:complete
MATKGTAAKSASGAAMSKYDVEVEKRLQVIEARLAEIDVKFHELKEGVPSPDGVAEKLDDLINRLGKKISF